MLYSSPAWFVTAMLTAMFRCPDHNTEQSESLEIPAFSVVKLLHYCTRAGSLQSGTTIPTSRGRKYSIGTTAECWARCSTSECVLLSMMLWTVKYHYGFNTHMDFNGRWMDFHTLFWNTHAICYALLFWHIVMGYPCSLYWTIWTISHIDLKY